MTYSFFFFYSESDILHHDKQYEPFYSSFVALSAHYITTVCGQSMYPPLNSRKYYSRNPFLAIYLVCFLSIVPRNQLLSVAAACKVLIEFSLMRLENPDEACAVSQVRNLNCTGDINVKGQKSTVDLTIVLYILPQKHLILLIKGLCTGCSRLDRTEIITFTAMMKSAKLPQTVKTLSDGVYLIKFNSVLVILRSSSKIIPSLFGILMKKVTKYVGEKTMSPVIEQWRIRRTCSVL